MKSKQGSIDVATLTRDTPCIIDRLIGRVVLTKPQQTSLLRVYSRGPRGIYGPDQSYRDLAALGLIEEVRPKRWRCTAKGERLASRQLELFA